MAQDGTTAGGASYTIDNVTFPVGRTKLQSIFNAIRTNNKGSSAPDLTAGQFWLDDSNDPTWTLYLYDGTDSIQFATINTTDNSVNFIDSTFTQLTSDLSTNGNDINFGNNDKAVFGAGSDLEIYSDGTNSRITESGSGSLIIRGTQLILQSPAGENLAYFFTNGEAQLYHNGVQKLATKSTGIDVTGTVTADGLSLGDNETINVGASNDLQIYHDGSNSYIDDAGDGRIYIRGDGGVTLKSITTDETLALFNQNGKSELYHNGVAKLATTSTGIDVTGTVVSDGLTVDGNATFEGNYVHIESTQPKLRFLESDTTDENFEIRLNAGSARFLTKSDDLSTIDRERMRIDNSTGDISFYEDTGTTPKFFWDASAESLGIGTTSPNGIMELRASGDTNFFVTAGTNTNSSQLVLGDPDDIDVGKIRYRHNIDRMEFNVNASERMVIDSSGNVGIGTVSPVTLKSSTTLQVDGNAKLGDDNGRGLLSLGDIASTGANVGIWRGAGGAYAGTGNYLNLGGYDGITFTTGNADIASQTERMRIDSSGKVLVGKTASGDTVGAEIWPVGYIALKRASTMLNLNRTSDGSLVNFQKSSVDIGSIGSAASTDLYVASGDTGFRIVAANDNLRPCTSTGGNRDNAMDLGEAAVRFDDIFATNGTIQTSDQNEKQSIQALTSSEIVVAQRISKLFKTFKFNSAVEEKGDSARTHTGVIAQDVQQAFTDEGLDAGNYALFISDTWWEKEIFVDAVEAQDAIYETQTDEEGNETQVLVQEAVEAKDAYSHIDVVYEATEGYTQRTRLGIRYPELLSFVSSAFEQRLTNIETRLRALET